jgi:hypothetical protein
MKMAARLHVCMLIPSLEAPEENLHSCLITDSATPSLSYALVQLLFLESRDLWIRTCLPLNFLLCLTS